MSALITPEFIKRAEELAAESPKALVALFAFDETCQWASPSHLAILGYTNDEMIGRSWKEFVAPEDHAHATLVGDDAIMHGRSINFTIRARHKSGSRIQLKGVTWIMIDKGIGLGCLVFEASPSPAPSQAQ